MFVKCFCGKHLIKNVYLVKIHFRDVHKYTNQEAEKRARDLCK